MAAKAGNRTERAVKGTLASFLQYGMQMLLQAFLAPLVLRLAGQETLGAYAVLVQVLGYLSMLDLGVTVSLNVFMARAHSRDDRGKRLGEVLSTARSYLCVSNALVASIIFLLSLKAGSWLHISPQMAGPVRASLLLLAAWQLVKGPWLVYGIGLNATQNLALLNFTGIAGNAARLCFSLGLVAAGHGLVGLTLANLAAEALTYLLTTYHFRRLYPAIRPVWGIPDRGLLREMLVFGLHSLLVNIAWRLVYLTDNIVVGYLYGAAAVSIYYATQMPATIAFNIVNRVHDNASPALNELQALREEEKLRRSFLKLHRVSNLLALPIAAGVLLLNRELITLWLGKTQYAGDAMTMALAAFILLTTVNHLTYIVFIASGRLLFFGIVGIVEGLTNLALSLWLGKVYGLSGVMWSSVIANGPATALVLYVSMRRLGIRLPEYLGYCLLRPLIPAVCGLAAGWLAGKALTGGSWLALLCQGALLVAVYCAVAYLVGFTSQEREWLRGRCLALWRRKRQSPLSPLCQGGDL